ncbi:MAG: rod shape-determining protein MreD [Candidatus Omnitrophica bacterium]|nr:rod shape-determining protein MreD [Candidatus Omnitrophota bacterium]
MYRINIMAVAILIICAALIQINAFDFIEFFGIKPDLLLVLVIFFALNSFKQESIKIALISGLIKDISSSSVLGSYTLAFFIIAFFLNFHQTKFYRERISTQGLVAFVSYIAMSFIVLLINLIAYKSALSYYMFLSIAFKGAVYTAIIAPGVFFILSKFLRIRLASTL